MSLTTAPASVSTRSGFARRIAVAGALGTALAGIVASFSSAAPAPQDALGDGRGLEHRSGSGRSLDSNLLRGSGGSNTPNMQEDYRSRNLIVTGNVAGGRGFRGNVNYTADRDFRGATSDSTTYAFRAGSAFSDPNVIRAGTMGDRLNVARTYGSIEYGRASISGSVLGGDVNGQRLRIDQSAARLTSSAARRAMTDQSTLGTYDTPEGGVLRLQTGAFTGVRANMESDAVDALDLGLYDTARLKQDVRSGSLDEKLRKLNYRDPLRRDDREAQDDDAANGGSSNQIRGTRIDTGIKAMDSIVRALDSNLERSDFGFTRRSETGESPTGAEPTAPDDMTAAERRAEERRTDFSHELDALRREIRGTAPRRPRGVGETGDPDDPDGRSVPDPGGDRPKLGDAEKGIGAGGETGSGGGARSETDAAAIRRKSLDDIAALLAHGHELTTLSDSQVARIREITALGEQAMKRNGYFLAEQHFSLALTLDPRNPLAQAGIANAQLGAGLVASASITLRNLFADHPELIDARFAPELLPSKDRMKALVEKLGTTSTDARNAADVGLALAYLGRQLGERDVIDRGLAMMKGNPGDETLSKLLRGVWLGEKVDASVPAPPPPAAPPVVTPP